MCSFLCSFLPFQPGEFLTKTRTWGENAYESVMEAIMVGAERECSNATTTQKFPPKWCPCQWWKHHFQVHINKWVYLLLFLVVIPTWGNAGESLEFSCHCSDWQEDHDGAWTLVWHRERTRQAASLGSSPPSRLSFFFFFNEILLL